MPSPVEGLLEVCEDMTESYWLLEIFLMEDSYVEDLLWCSFLLWSLPVLQQWSSPLAPSICSVWSSALLCLTDWWGWWFSDPGTAVACLSWEMLTKDWVHRVGHSSVCQILSQIVVRAVITSSPHAWTSTSGMLSTSADFSFFSACTAASNSLQRIGWSSSVSVWGQFSTNGSPLALWLYSSVQYFVH